MVPWRLRPRFRSCPSQIKQWTGVVEAHSMQLAHLYIYTLFNVSCSSCLSRNGIITNMQRNRQSETNSSLLGSGRTLFLKDCSRHMLDTPMAKPRSRWPESSLPNSFNFSNITLVKIFRVINFRRMLPSTKYF